MPPNQYLPPKIRRPHQELTPAVSKIVACGFVVAGSYRRGKATVGDLDIVVPHYHDFGEAEEIMRTFFNYVPVRSGQMKSEGVSSLNGEPLLLNLWRVPSSQAWAGMLLYATGPMDLNIMMRAKAQSKEWKLNQYGLFELGVLSQEDTRQLDNGEEEKQIFELLDIQYLTPVERENWREHLLPRQKTTGTFVSVLSSDGVTTYDVEITNGKAVECPCKGFGYRHTCRHLAEAERKYNA